GLQPEVLMSKGYGRHLHFWDLRRRRHMRAVPLGQNNQFVLELRPAHDPTRRYGFAGVVISLEDLSSSVWLWHHRDGEWQAEEVIRVPAEPADPASLPPALQPFAAVPPLVTDINLSLDDRFLYVSCWGTGELRQYDVSDPLSPQFTGSVHLGGIVRRAAHPTDPGRQLNGGPQMIEVSRDGRRVYVTNSLYRTWDDQFYPDGIRGWLARLDVGEKGGIAPSRDFFLEFDEYRPHQVRLGGGDASSDSFCYP